MYKATANLLIVCFLCWMTGCSSTNTVSEDLVPTDYVNPFIGASTSVGAAGVYHGLGKTFPGATTPYGMVQVSPNTIREVITVPDTVMNIRQSKDLPLPR